MCLFVFVFVERGERTKVFRVPTCKGLMSWVHRWARTSHSIYVTISYWCFGNIFRKKNHETFNFFRLYSAIWTLPKSASSLCRVCWHGLNAEECTQTSQWQFELLHLRLIEAVQAWNLKVSIVTGKARDINTWGTILFQDFHHVLWTCLYCCEA